MLMRALNQARLRREVRYKKNSRVTCLLVWGLVTIFAISFRSSVRFRAFDTTFEQHTSVDVVISLCHTPIDWVHDWLEELPSQVLLRTIFVRSKCKNVALAEALGNIFERRQLEIQMVVTQVHNIGRNDYEYVQHIVENYAARNFADVVFFLKDSAHEYPLDFLRKLNKKGSEMFLEVADGRNSGFSCMRRPDSANFPGALDLHDRKHLLRFRLEKYLTADDFGFKGSDARYVQSNLTFCGFLEHCLNNSEKAALHQSDHVPVCYGGAFAVRGSSIMKVSLNSWSRISAALGTSFSGENLHFMERSFAMLLSGSFRFGEETSRDKVLTFAETGGNSYPGLLYGNSASKTKRKKKKGKNRMQSLEREDVFVIMLHNHNLEGSIEYARRLVHFLASRDKVVITIAPVAGPAEQLLHESGAMHTLVWPKSVAMIDVDVTYVMKFTFDKLGITPDVLVFNTILWSATINANEPYTYGNPRVVWIIHEWSITRYTLEPSSDPSDSKLHWFGEDRPELYDNNLRHLALQADAIVFVAHAQRHLWRDFVHWNDHVIPGSFTIQSSHKAENCGDFSRKALHLKSTTLC